jgi:Zn-dependent membrane protease YugP
MFFDPMYFVFMIPGMIFMLWAQSKVKGTYHRYAKVPNSLRITGAQAARQILDAAGLPDVPVSQTPGELNDHYDPRKRALFLSPRVYNEASIASIGIAAHEAGHAMQHAARYAPLTARSAIVPAVNIGSNVGLGLLILGIIIGATGLAWAGVALFALGTVFALITLPVEFDASKRARAALVGVGIADGGMDGGPESAGVKKVLDAAAWTYIAGFAVALLNLLYYVSLVTGMSRDE